MRSKLYTFFQTIKNLFSRQSLQKKPGAFEIFSSIPLFAGIPKKQLRKLFNLSHEIQLQAGDYLFEEGDIPKEFYILMEGTVEIMKEDDLHLRQHHLTTLGVGQTVGEMALLDEGPRSAAVRAKTPVKLFSIPFTAINTLAKQHVELYKVYHSVAKNMSQRLRDTNRATILALEKQLEESQIRVRMGKFMVNIFTVICLFTFSLSGLNYLSATLASQSFITIPLMVILSIVFFHMMKTSGLPASSFGLNTFQWKRAVLESVLFTIPLCIFVLLIKLFQIHYISRYFGHAVFEPLAFVKSAKAATFNPWLIWGLTLIFYCFFVAPIQELIVRGGLQASLTVFLTEKNRNLIAILLSNLIFSTIHVYISSLIALIVFIAGVYLGWLYSRHKTLIGVTISHIMLGVWAFWIVGMFA